MLVTVHAFVCKHQEDSDLLLTLYDGDEMKAITENYVVKWGRQGLARDLDQFDNHRVLFTVRYIAKCFRMLFSFLKFPSRNLSNLNIFISFWHVCLCVAIVGFE